ncbi:Gfo/Idh/MocA family protein [Mammaliicoccus stepanovicii]|uniref:NADH-dependent dehydrogenase n=1 Tax=Mammaliicoccus stepanovicii TaxID=643214 RepID=A0A240A629_9STAP|nr:Gfo/Idh/MocA family oxidoreductase [Mammaliicoccus stepanovicii]PNZ78043.1 oxidoreductase [Mammaliicoccus stepanovicii]GGI39581.1 oxidoreductase [Mammaliicoccus stepanovicii]SNV78767.1 NADH-dependent dehydrogenase [Mammaliicoccus stepanovicii]
MGIKKAILLGAGDRGGKVYANLIKSLPHEIQLVAVAEPIKERRERISKEHHIEGKSVYASWVDLLNDRPDADVAIICTQDKEHFEPTMKALDSGYHVLLEKPMSPSAGECIKMVEKSEEMNKTLTICHVLRYTPFWNRIKKIVENGDIGEVASIQLNENVEYMHMSHSFVRGNWKSKETSSPMILAKSCHDMDIISYIMDKDCKRINSFGSLMYFNESNKPEGAPLRCLDGCPAENECPFHAGRYYLGRGKGWAMKFTEENTNEAIIKSLQTTDYGKCVFQSDNDVVDHQVVNMEFDNGATATFSMSAFTREQTRIVQIMGTKGEIRGNMETNEISVFDFLTREEKVVKFPEVASGHGGGDEGIIKDFIQTINRKDNQTSKSVASKSLISHLMAFAAEESRLNQGQSINIDEFYTKIASGE